jgi:hypothetical protein
VRWPQLGGDVLELAELWGRVIAALDGVTQADTERTARCTGQAGVELFVSLAGERPPILTERYVGTLDSTLNPEVTVRTRLPQRLLADELALSAALSSLRDRADAMLGATVAYKTCISVLAGERGLFAIDDEDMWGFLNWARLALLSRAASDGASMPVFLEVCGDAFRALDRRFVPPFQILTGPDGASRFVDHSHLLSAQLVNGVIQMIGGVALEYERLH